MGRMQAEEIVALADIDMALHWHLSANHYPPITFMFDACKESITAVLAGEPDTLIELPEGVTWKDQKSAPAWAIVDGHHLESFIDHYELEYTE